METYLWNGNTYDIPQKDIKNFLSQNPDAVKVFSYKNNGSIYDIPENEVNDFLQYNPDATPLYPDSSSFNLKEYPDNKIKIETALQSEDPAQIKNAVSSLAKSFISGFGNLSKSIAILAKKVNIGNEYDGIPVEELATYKFGQAIQDLAEEYFPTDERLQKSFFATTLPSAFGSMGFYMLGGMSARALKLGAYGTSTVTALMGSFDAGASGFDEAKAAGASDKDAYQAYFENMGWGATEAIPIGRIFNKLDNLSSGIMKQMISKYSTRKLITEGAKQGLEEMVQEFGQQIGQNWTAQRLYDFNRELLDGAMEGGIAGFITGTAMASLGMKMRERKLKKIGLTENDIKLLDEAIENNEKFLKNQTKAILSPQEVIDEIKKSSHEVQGAVDQGMQAAAEGFDNYQDAPPYTDWMYEQGIDQVDYDQALSAKQAEEMLDQGIAIAAGVDALQSQNEMNIVGETNLDNVQDITNKEGIESLADLNIQPDISLEELQDLDQAEALGANLYESTPNEVNPQESTPTTQNQELSGQVKNKETTYGKTIKIFNEDANLTLDKFNSKQIDLAIADFPYGIDANYENFVDNKENVKKLIDNILPKLNDKSKLTVVFPGHANKDLYPKPDKIIKWNYKNADNLKYKSQDIYLYGNISNVNFESIESEDVSDRTYKGGFIFPKPTGIIQSLINKLSKKGDLVYDPFIGSGTTAIAGLNTGRKVIGSEIDNKTFSYIKKRLDTYGKNINVDLTKSTEYIKTELSRKIVDYLKNHYILIEQSNFQDPLLFIDLANKIARIDINGEFDLSKVAAEFTANMISYTGDFYDVYDIIKTTKIFKDAYELLKEQNKDDRVKDKQLKRRATIPILSDILENSFNKKYMEENNLPFKVIGKIKRAFNKLKAAFSTDEFLKLQNIADSIVDKIVSGDNFIRRTIKNVKQLNFQEAIDASPDKAKLLEEIMSDKSFMLTGSIAFSTQGTVYRDPKNAIHDLDIVNTKSIEYAKEFIQKINPNSIKVYDFFSNNMNVLTYLVPLDKSNKINIISRNENGKVTEYNVVDGNGNIVGNYKLNEILDKDGNVVDSREIKTGQEALFVDFFNDKIKRDGLDYKFIGTDGKLKTIKISEFGAAFEAKLTYSRFKDIWDYNRFNQYTKEQINKNEKEIIEKHSNSQQKAIVQTKIEDTESISNETLTSLNDQEDENGRESIENEPIYGSNHIVNELLKNKVITKDKIAETAASISALAKNSKTINDFEMSIVKEYGDILPSELVAKVFLRENTLDSMSVYDVDFTEKTASVSESNFIDANGKDLSNRFLLNGVLRPYVNDLAIINLYSMDDTGIRTSSLTTRNLSKQDLLMLTSKLMQKGFALLPLSDSDTVLAVKIDKKYLRNQNESYQDHYKRLVDTVKKNYPEVKDIDTNINNLVIDLTRADFLNKTLKFWYNADRAANDVAKRFKLFLPKGVELKFKRNIKMQIVPDITLKDKNGNDLLKSDGTPFVVTDGTTFGNPQTYREFTNYNQLGDITQHKTIITQSDGTNTIAVKHMTHILTQKEWNRLADKLGFDKDIDLIAFDSAAKIANNKDGRLDYSKTIEIQPESIRHIFSGSEHLVATFSRQIFNFTGIDKNVTQHIIDNVIQPVFNKIHEKFELLESNPQALKTEIGRLIGEVDENLSDYRRYLNLDAYHYKTLRSNIRKLLKNKYIIDGYIKLRQKGGIGYLMPDYRNVLNRGEVMIPFVQYRRIAELAQKKGYKGSTLKELNDWLANNEIKLLTYRPPIPKPDNIQSLRVKAILPKQFGSALVMNAQDVVINKEGDMDGDEVFFHYFENESDVKYISEQIAQSHRNVGEIELGKGDVGPAFNHKNMLETGYMAALGKKAVGETAKASTVRAILESNNVRIGKFPGIGDEYYYAIINKNNVDNAVEIYELRKDWKEFDRKIAYTLQASVDNLKQFALHDGEKWEVTSDGFVQYNLKDLYRQMFNNMPSDGVKALKPIRNALNIFSKDFETGGQFTQEKMNELAWTYRAYVEASDGALGNSPHEKMIMDIAELGFLPRFVSYDYLTNKFQAMDGPKEQFVNAIHDKAHELAVSEIKKEIVDGKTVVANITEDRRKQIQGAVKALYNEYKKLNDSKTSSGKDYITLFDRFRDNFKSKLHQHEIVYADYLTFMGYNSKKGDDGKYYVTKSGNSRFILNVMDDVNIKKFTEIFNKHYNELLEKGKNSIEFAGIWKTVNQPTTLGLGGGFSNNSQVKFKLDLAIIRFFKTFNLGMQYSKDDKTAYDNAVKLVDQINRELYEIGRLPFSDAVDIKVLYKDVLEQRGKKLDETTELKAADGFAILTALKKLRHSLRTGRVNSFNKYFYFTKDLLIKNPYTTGVIKRIDKITNQKDADTWKFTSVISNIEKNDQIRELLDLKNMGKTDVSRVHAAEYVLNLHSEIQKALILKDNKKVNKLKSEIKELLNRDSILKEQVAIINDVVLALDGSLGNKGQREGYYRSQLLNKYGENVVKAFDKARKLLDDIIEYDVKTWNDEIGPHDSEYYEVEKDGITYKAKSRQYIWVQKLKKQLRDSGWTEKDINSLVKKVVVLKPERRDNYYPHNHFGFPGNSKSDIDASFLNNFDNMTTEEINLTAKGIFNWNQRTADTQSLDSMADRNLFRVLTRRANSSVNLRYTNRFRSSFEIMTSRINDGVKELAAKGDVNGLKQLIEIRAVAESMYRDITRIPQFSWARSMINIVKGLYVSNLLLLSTKGNLRNFTQGIFPNFVEFGRDQYNKGVNFSKNNDSIVFADGSEHNIFDSLGIARADIFAKVEGGQEWDIYQSYRDVLELQNAEGRSAKAKVLAKQYMQSIEAKMNNFVKTAGENNIFTLTWSTGKKLFYKTTNKLTGKFIIPDINPRVFSFSMIERNNRRRTAAMAFNQRWNDLRNSQKKQRIGMTKEELTALDKRNYDIALKYASDMIDKIQFNYNAWNRPAGIRGPLKSTLFQFKSFTLGMAKLHWNWIFDVAMNPYKEWRKVMYFSMISLITGGLTKFFDKDFWRFFEIPEYEYLAGFYDWIFGNSKERKWAFYGNKLTPISGPIGGMAFEGMIGLQLADYFIDAGYLDTFVERELQEDVGKSLGIYGQYSSRRRIAMQRLVESHVPFLKEYDDIYKNIYDTYAGNIGFDKAISNYIGLYDVFEPTDNVSLPDPFKKKAKWLPEATYDLLRKLTNKYTR